MPRNRQLILEHTAHFVSQRAILLNQLVNRDGSVLLRFTQRLKSLNKALNRLIKVNRFLLHVQEGCDKRNAKARDKAKGCTQRAEATQ